MTGEMTPGEIQRTLARIERQQQDGQRAVDDRITRLAADMVPMTLWAAENKALADDVRHIADDMREANERAEKTAQERMQALRGEIKGVRQAQEAHAKTHAESSAWSRSKTMTVIAIVVGAAATLVGAYIAAFAAAGGVK